MNLFDQISEDIKQAMLAKDKVALDALRGIKKEFLEAKTAKGADGELSDERALLLETGGAVLHAKRYLEGCGRFLIHNVDILSNCDIKWFESQIADDAIATLLVSERETTRFLLFAPDSLQLVGWMNTDTGDYHVVSPDIVPAECRKLAFSGIHILSDKVLALMEQYVAEKGLVVDEVAGVRFPIMNFYMWLASKHPVYGVVAENLNFIDVGKLDAIKPAEEFVKSQERSRE